MTTKLLTRNKGQWTFDSGLALLEPTTPPVQTATTADNLVLNTSKFTWRVKKIVGDTGDLSSNPPSNVAPQGFAVLTDKFAVAGDGASPQNGTGRVVFFSKTAPYSRIGDTGLQPWGHMQGFKADPTRNRFYSTLGIDAFPDVNTRGVRVINSQTYATITTWIRPDAVDPAVVAIDRDNDFVYWINGSTGADKMIYRVNPDTGQFTKTGQAICGPGQQLQGASFYKGTLILTLHKFGPSGSGPTRSMYDRTATIMGFSPSGGNPLWSVNLSTTPIANGSPTGYLNSEIEDISIDGDNGRVYLVAHWPNAIYELVGTSVDLTPTTPVVAEGPTAPTNRVYSVLDYGAKDDAVETTATTTAGSKIVVLGSPVAGMVKGMMVAIEGARSSGGSSHFVTKIDSVQDSTHITTTANIQVAVAGKACYIGTNSAPGIQDGQEALRAAGGGTLVYPTVDKGHYLIDRATRMAEGVYHLGIGDHVRITNRWSVGSAHNLVWSAFCPGFMHGVGLQTTTNGTSLNYNTPLLKHVAVNNVAKGVASLTCKSAGEFSYLKVGDYIGLRSALASTQLSSPGSTTNTSYVETPHKLHLCLIRSITGDTLTMSLASPYDITEAVDGGVSIFRMQGPRSTTPDYISGTYGSGTDGFESQGHPKIDATGNWVYSQKEALWMTKDCGIENFELDATTPFWGGGVIRDKGIGEGGTLTIPGTTQTKWGFIGRKLRPHVDGRKWTSFVTVNSLCQALVEDCQDANYARTFNEWKLGSADVLQRRCSGSWYVGAATLTPLGIGEAAHNIVTEDCEFTLPYEFADNAKNFIDIRACQGVIYRRNIFHAEVGMLNAGVAIVGSSQSQGHSSNDILFEDNVWYVRGGTVTGDYGVYRGFVVGPTDTQAFPPKGVTIQRETFIGTLRPSVNEWLWAASGKDLLVQNNKPAVGMKARIGAAVTGTINV